MRLSIIPALLLTLLILSSSSDAWRRRRRMIPSPTVKQCGKIAGKFCGFEQTLALPFYGYGKGRILSYWQQLTNKTVHQSICENPSSHRQCGHGCQCRPSSETQTRIVQSEIVWLRVWKCGEINPVEEAAKRFFSECNPQHHHHRGHQAKPVASQRK